MISTRPANEFRPGSSESRGDEPEQILGNRTAPNAVEFLLAALGSCLSVGYAANAAAMGIELDTLRVKLEGEINLRGFLGIGWDTRAGYQSITCMVYTNADVPEEKLVELQGRVETTSPVMDTIMNAILLKIDVDVE